MMTLHSKQREAFVSNSQYVVCIAGVQSGKTFLGTHWSAKNIYEFPSENGLIVAPTYKLLQQSTLPKFFSQYPYYRQFYKEQKGEIGLAGEARVFIRSADSPLGLEGMTLKWAWLDEAGQMPSLVWPIIRSRTAINKGQVLITTTPYNMGWLYQSVYLPWKRGEDKDIAVYSWSSVDSPYFPKDFFLKEKQRLKPEEFNRRYCGEFTKMEGLVYELHQWHLIAPESLPRSFDVVLGGLDWGYTNPAALSVLALKNGKWYLLDEWYETGKTTREIIDAAIKLQNKWTISRWYADSANPEKIQEANSNTGLYVIPYEKNKDSIQAGISHIQQLLRENLFLVNRELKNALAEFESYCYPAEKTEKDLPIPENNHLMDTIRYVIHGYQPARRQKTPSLKFMFDNQEVKQTAYD